jgi:acyl-CoA reductase-like NAD-dependent aldehyde dehydrogenase
MTVAQPILPHDLRLPDIQATARGLYIDGQWLPSQSGQMIEVVHPSTEAVLKQSGLGREGGQHHGIAKFMEAKYIATSF